MYAVRRWATRNARSLEWLYRVSATAFQACEPMWLKIGARRLEKPFAATEGWIKGLMFDCQMCGRCVLSSTGMTCPANCPKSVRNGPCGGVRANGHCEVEPEMRCVWVEAWEGAKRMRETEAFHHPLPPRECDIEGTSAWLRLMSEKAARRATEAQTATSAKETPA